MSFSKTNFLYLFLTLTFCAMLTITQVQSQEYKYRYKADGVILHKNAQVSEPEPDPCLTGPIGTICEIDGAVYAGETGGIRKYSAPSDLPSFVNSMETAEEQCRSEYGEIFYLPSYNELYLIYRNRFYFDDSFLSTFTSNYYGYLTSMWFGGWWRTLNPITSAYRNTSPGTNLLVRCFRSGV